MNTTAPVNFSWLIDNKVCGMGFPWKNENIQFLVENNVGYLITLTAELSPEVDEFSDLKHVTCAVEEFGTPTLAQIKECLEFMDIAIQKGKAVGVHCFHGRGRTGTLLACYLVKNNRMSSKDAISFVRRRRPMSIETREQEEVVYMLECDIKGSG